MRQSQEDGGAKPETKTNVAFPSLSLPGSSREPGDGSVEEIGTQIGPYKLLSGLGEVVLG